MPRRGRAPRATREERLGAVIRALRRERGLSQERLAGLAGRTPEYISMLERGKKSPTFRTPVALATGLELRVSHIVRRYELD